jgi:hypothetical protein
VPSDPKSCLNQVVTASLLLDITTIPKPRLKVQKGRLDTIVAFTVSYLYLLYTVLL